MRLYFSAIEISDLHRAVQFAIDQHEIIYKDRPTVRAGLTAYLNLRDKLIAVMPSDDATPPRSLKDRQPTSIRHNAGSTPAEGAICQLGVSIPGSSSPLGQGVEADADGTRARSYMPTEGVARAEVVVNAGGRPGHGAAEVER